MKYEDHTLAGLDGAAAPPMKRGKTDCQGRSYSCWDDKKRRACSRLVVPLPSAGAVVIVGRLQLQQESSALHRTWTAAAKAEEMDRREKEEYGKEMRWGGAEIEPKRWWWKVNASGKREEIKAKQGGRRRFMQGKKTWKWFCFWDQKCHDPNL